MTRLRTRRTSLAVLAISAALALAACMPPAPRGRTSAPPPAATNPPVVTAVDPSSGAMTGGNEVIITGERFTGATEVLFGGAPAQWFAVDSDTQIRAIPPAGDAGPARVAVTGPDGTSVDEVDYTYTPVADLVATVTIQAASATEYTIVGRVTNDGPAPVDATSVTVGVDQDRAVTTSSYAVTGTASSTGTCQLSGNPGTAVGWQVLCDDVALAPGEHLEITLSATYADTPVLEAYAQGFDGNVEDALSLNNGSIATN